MKNPSIHSKGGGGGFLNDIRLLAQDPLALMDLKYCELWQNIFYAYWVILHASLSSADFFLQKYKYHQIVQ